MKPKRSNSRSLAVNSSANRCATPRIARFVLGLRGLVCSTKHASDELVHRLRIALNGRVMHGTADDAAVVGADQ
jgi:hypothetical protein